jgi:hypothetical protein
VLVVKQICEPRQTIGDRQYLVDLFLVLRDDEVDARALEHKRDFVGDGILVDRHRNRAEHLRRRHRPIEPRPIRPGYRDPVALGEPEIGEALRERPRLLVDLAPGPGPPNAEHLVPKRRSSAADARMTPQQLGESVVQVIAPRRQAQHSLPRGADFAVAGPVVSTRIAENNRQSRDAIALPKSRRRLRPRRSRPLESA